MTETHPLGPELEPPRGGLSRLQRAVEHEHRSPGLPGGYWLAAGLAAGLILLAIFVPWRTPPGQQRIHEAVRSALAVSATTHFRNAAYTEIPSHSPDVRILLVGSLGPPQHGPKSQ